MIGFIFGLFVGVFAGMFVMGLCRAAGDPAPEMSKDDLETIQELEAARKV
jgi:hypothetical protein